MSLLQRGTCLVWCQAGLPETLKQFIKGLKVPFPGRGVDNYVIPVVIHTVEIINKFLHSTFQRRGRIHHPEWHFKELVWTIWSDKGGLVSILFRDVDLPVSLAKVDFGEALVST